MNDAILDTGYHISGRDDRHYRLIRDDQRVSILQMWSMGGNILVKDQIFPIQPQHVLILNCIEPHCANPLDTEKYIRSKIIVSPDYFKRLVDVMSLSDADIIKDFNRKGYLYLAPAAEHIHEIDHVFQLCAQYHQENGLFSTSMIAEQIIHLLILLLSANPNAEQAESSNQMAAQIVSYIQGNFMDPEFSLDRMSRELHISKYHACHLFKDALSITVGNYVSELKLMQARKLLINTSMQVSKIAETLNLTVNSFCRLFKAKHQCTPLEYRKRYKPLSEPLQTTSNLSLLEEDGAFGING